MNEAAFDEDYYRRFYFDRKTRVIDRAHVDRLGAFVCSYVQYLGVPVKRVLDVGCGIGLWREVIARHFPRARYQGVEYSSYLCERFGWERGSVVDYAAKQPFELVICQGVLPYLEDRAARSAMQNLARLCTGALYVEAVADEDWRDGIVDAELTDRAMKRRPSAFYRRGLRSGFTELGGGVWLRKEAGIPVYALERSR